MIGACAPLKRECLTWSQLSGEYARPAGPRRALEVRSSHVALLETLQLFGTMLEFIVIDS